MPLSLVVIIADVYKALLENTFTSGKIKSLLLGNKGPFPSILIQHVFTLWPKSLRYFYISHVSAPFLLDPPLKINSTGNLTHNLPFDHNRWIEGELQQVPLLRKQAPEVGLPSVCSLQCIRLVRLDLRLHLGFGILVGEIELDFPKLLILWDNRGKVVIRWELKGTKISCYEKYQRSV